MRHSRIKALPRELVTPVALAVLADRFLMDSPKEHRGIYGGEPATLDVPVQGVCGCWRTHIVRAELLGGASSSRSSAARQPGRSIARAAGRANAADDLTPIFLLQQIAVIKANQAVDNMIGYGPRV